MLSLSNIHHHYGTNQVLDDIYLEIKQGEIICLLGPSGCGKTTLLRLIAGLEKPSDGDIKLESKSILTTPVAERNFGLMFQDFALFPHLNVGENITFGLKMRGVDRAEQQNRLQELLELIGLENYARRDINELSGGERQRVALARSLAPRPRLLMLDEPIGSLDAALRERLVVDLHKIIKQQQLTAIYVTHDQREAYAIADRVVVLNAGQIEQIATPQELYQSPKTRYIAQFIGLQNIVKDETLQQINVIPEDASRSDYWLIRPEAITVTEEESDLQAQIKEVIFRGNDAKVVVSLSDIQRLTFTVPTPTQLEPEQNCYLKINPNQIVPLAE